MEAQQYTAEQKAEFKKNADDLQIEIDYWISKGYKEEDRIVWDFVTMRNALLRIAA